MGNPEKNLVRLIDAPVQRSTTLQVDFVTADQIGVTYDMMPGTRPQDTGALVAIWQDADLIPWENPPLATQPIGSQQHGSLSFGGLTVQSNQYIVGLLVGPTKTDTQKARNTAASAFIPNDKDPPVPRASFLTLKFVGTNSVAVQFNCLGGYRAQTDGAWMGIWRGEAASYFQPPDAVAQVRIDSNFGTVAFNNFPIGIGLTYTIGFFNSGWSDDPTQRNQKVLSCSLTFTQGQERRS